MSSRLFWEALQCASGRNRASNQRPGGGKRDGWGPGGPYSRFFVLGPPSSHYCGYFVVVQQAETEAWTTKSWCRGSERKRAECCELHEQVQDFGRSYDCEPSRLSQTKERQHQSEHCRWGAVLCQRQCLCSKSSIKPLESSLDDAVRQTREQFYHLIHAALCGQAQII